MASESTEQTKQKRELLKLRFNKFVQKVNATYKIQKTHQEQKLVPPTQADVKQIIEDLYNFLVQFGYIFFLNIFVPHFKVFVIKTQDENKKTPIKTKFVIQQLKQKQQIPIITKLMLTTLYWVKNQSKYIMHKNQQIMAICVLIQMYCKDLKDLLNDFWGETMKQDLTNVDDLIGVINMVMIQLSKNAPKGTRKIDETQRSTKFIEISKYLLPQIAVIDPKTSNNTIKQKFLIRSAKILKMWPQTFLQQRILNRYKQTIERSIQKCEYKSDYCCSIFIGVKQQFLKLESKHHEHKNYHWPIVMPSIIKHVKKTIVGFLNLEGGIIYVGMKEGPNNVQPLGIYLTSQEIPDFFQWVHQLCDSIYPQLKKDGQQDYEQNYKKELYQLRNRSKLEQNSQYIVNKYVAIQYLSVIDKDTYEDCYQQIADQLKRLYLVRIKIKPGCKFDTFHLLKQDKNGEIECFMRSDSSVNKLTLEKFYQLYYDRMIEYLNEAPSDKVKDLDCPKVHFNFLQS